ncbi:MAG TPA: branched-chain amino acid ABC transporter permease [Acetobacteraceae bacterium]|nr:branched-chain amino acid ABC transporter permease [Acetobacteraceae bacterium]
MSARRIAVWLIGLVVLLAPAVLMTGYHLFQLTSTAIYAVAILGLDIVSGYTGQVSLGHGAFYAIGAYVTAILMTDFNWPFWATLPVAGGASALVGFLIGFPALRLSGPYLALVTLALAFAVPQILRAKALEAWTGGAQGIVVTAPDPPDFLPLTQDQFLYLSVIIVAVILYVLAANMLRGRQLRAMLAIRDQPLAAEAAGIDTARIKIRAFAVSAFFTGIAGALSAVVVQFVAPDSFAATLSIALFVGLVVGGAASLPGTVIGAVFVQFIPNLAEMVNKSAPGVIYGVLLVAALYFMPEGGAGALRGLLARRAASRASMPSVKTTKPGATIHVE